MIKLSRVQTSGWTRKVTKSDQKKSDFEEKISMLYFSILNQVVVELKKKISKFDRSLEIDTTCSENWTKTTKKH